MNVSTDKINQLLDEIDILEKDVKKYKHIWKKAKANYEYMFEQHAEKEDIIKQNEIFMDFITDYAIAQKKLHRYNHDHCVKHVIDCVPHDQLLNVSKVFEERLKERCKDKPGTFELIMKSLNIDSSIKG
jgi:hypothetical protein